MAGAEKRQYVRVKTAGSVEVTTDLVGGRRPRTIRGSCLDVSVNGALLVLSEPLELDDEILVSFQFGPISVECAAIVLRSEPTSKPGRWRMGCQFQGIAKETYLKLNRFVEEKLRLTIRTPK